MRRTFASADVNSVIVLFSSPDDSHEWALDKTARFVMFRVPFEHILSPVIFDEIEEATERKATKEYRVFPIQQSKLLEDGCEIPEEEEETAGPLIKTTRYIGNKWGGKYLRAPDIYWTILEKGKGKLVRLGDIADVRRGFTTGANDFFYVRRETARQWDIEQEFLRPVVKTPRDYYSIVMSKVSDLSLFYCRKRKSELAGTNALRYISWGEKQGFHKRPSCRSRELWYMLPAQPVATMLWPAALFERYICYLPPKGALADKLFYVISGNLPPLTRVFLNSAVTALFVEVFGYQLNHGGVFVTVDQILDFPVLHGDCPQTLTQAFNDLSNRDIDLFSRERLDADRKLLDTEVLAILGISALELEPLYDIIAQSIADRIHKARRELTKESQTARGRA